MQIKIFLAAFLAAITTALALPVDDIKSHTSVPTTTLGPEEPATVPTGWHIATVLLPDTIPTPTQSTFTPEKDHGKSEFFLSTLHTSSHLTTSHCPLGKHHEPVDCIEKRMKDLLKKFWETPMEEEKLEKRNLLLNVTMGEKHKPPVDNAKYGGFDGDFYWSITSEEGWESFGLEERHKNNEKRRIEFMARDIASYIADKGASEICVALRKDGEEVARGLVSFGMRGEHVHLDAERILGSCEIGEMRRMHGGFEGFSL